MGPKPADERSDHDLFHTELVNLIDQLHGLVELTELIEWQAFADAWSPQFVSATGRPALPTRLMAALLYLKKRVVQGRTRPLATATVMPVSARTRVEQ